MDNFTQAGFHLPSLKLTATFENQWLEDDSCPFGALNGLFSGIMSVSGNVFVNIVNVIPNLNGLEICLFFNSGFHWNGTPC